MGQGHREVDRGPLTCVGPGRGWGQEMVALGLTVFTRAKPPVPANSTVQVQGLCGTARARVVQRD